MQYKIDVSNLKSIGVRAESGETSFSTTYIRALEGEIENISRKTPASLQDEVQQINGIFREIRERLAEEMQQYMLSHDGVVGRWPRPASNLVLLSRLNRKIEYQFDYFGRDYIYDPTRKVQVYRPRGSIFLNGYVCRNAPDAHENRTRAIESWDSAREAEMEKAKSSVSEAAQARLDAKRVRRGRFWGVLGILLSLFLIVLAVMGGPLYPLKPDLDPRDLNASVLTWLDENVHGVWEVLLFLPTLLFSLGLQVSGILWTLMAMLYGQSTVWFGVGCAVLLVLLIVGLCVIQSILPARGIFARVPEHGTGKKYKQAKKALEKLRRSEDADRRSFKESDALKEAERQDREAVERAEKERPELEKYALEWQQMWYNAVRADSELLSRVARARDANFIFLLEPPVSENVEELFEGAEDAEQAEDREDALKLYTMAAEKGHARAQFRLGEIYSEENGPDRDYTVAAEWMAKAAAQGVKEAKTMLGIFYWYGRGVPKDTAKALELLKGTPVEKFFRPADGPARQETRRAERPKLDLEVAFKPTDAAADRLMREGLEAYRQDDYGTALECFRQAAERGDMDAQFNYGLCFYDGQDYPMDLQKAKLWFERAAEQGHIDAQYLLGGLYDQGIEMPRDAEKALYWLERSAKQGKTAAMCAAASLLISGNGIPKDTDRGLMWFDLADEKGSAEAAYKLGVIYLTGHDVEKDRERARAYLEKASAQGNKDARSLLRRQFGSAGE